MLVPTLKEIGYSRFLLEGGIGKAGLMNRITLTAGKYPYDEINKVVGRYRLILIRPTSRDCLVKAINDERICCLVFDNMNYYLYKESLARLLMRKGKLVEVWLHSSSHEAVRRAIKLGSRGVKLVFSSCPSRLSEVWTPISKLNYLVVLGAPTQLGIVWLFSFPQEMYNNASAHH